MYYFLTNPQELNSVLLSVISLMQSLRKKFKFDTSQNIHLGINTNYFQEESPSKNKIKSVRKRLISPIYDNEGILDDSFTAIKVNIIPFLITNKSNRKNRLIKKWQNTNQCRV